MPHIPVFSISCWALGVMALSQLVIASMALSERLEASRQVREIIKEVPKYIPITSAAPAQPLPSPPPLYFPPPTASLPLPPPTPLTIPRVGDPRSERMMNEAREAKVAGDMDRAIIKLEEALSQSPEDPNIHYELGLVFEQMGIFDSASAHFEKVFQMGISGAGALYELAATKLREGFTPETLVGKLSLGRVRIFNDPNEDETGKRVILSIPVQKAPVADIDTADIAVSVTFFNRTSKGDIAQLEDKSWVTEKWSTLPFDWAGGEETLRMTYVIPEQDPQTLQIFGKPTYYGQVVSLLYKGEVLDVQAWPRDLAAKIPQAPSSAPANPLFPEFQDTLPPDFDPNMPLLPKLPAP